MSLLDTPPAPHYFKPEHEQFREQVRRFCEREIKPHYRDWEKAGPALRALQSTAAEQVKFVRERLTGEVPDADREKAVRKRVAELIANLGDDDFDTRIGAVAELEKLGDAARQEIVAAAKSPVT